MNKIILALSVLLYFASCSSNSSTETETENQDSTLVEEQGISGEYSIDLANSYATWGGAHVIGSSHNGQIQLNEGSFTIENGLITSGEIILNLSTISAEDMTGKTEDSIKLTNHLKNPDFFNIDTFPFASFEVTGSKIEGENMILSGNLTIKEISKPISISTKVDASETTFTAMGEAEVNRTDWGLIFHSKDFFKDLAADRVIKDEMKVGFNITAKPQ